MAAHIGRRLPRQPSFIEIPTDERLDRAPGLAPKRLPLPRPDGGVVTQRTANPCTPVRFRLGPPFFLNSGPKRLAGAPLERERAALAAAAVRAANFTRGWLHLLLRRDFLWLRWGSRDWGHREREQASRARDDPHAPARRGLPRRVHSYLKAWIGLARATFIAWPTTVAIAIPRAIAAATRKGTGVSAIR